MKVTQITEALDIKTAKKYSKDWEKDRYKELFAKAGAKFRIYIPFDEPGSLSDKSLQVMTEIQGAFNTMEIFYANYWDKTYGNLPKLTEENYRKGTVSNGKQVFKIGKMLQTSMINLKNGKIVSDGDSPLSEAQTTKLVTMFERVYNLFMKDNERTKVRKFLICISRHPYDIAGMSTNRNWTSCTNLVSGSNRHYIYGHSRNGNLIAYVIREEDKNITKPLSRINILRYDNIEDKSDYILIAHDESYGTRFRNFSETVQAYIDELTGQADKVAGVYCSTEGSYTDGLEQKRHYGKFTDENSILKFLDNMTYVKQQQIEMFTVMTPDIFKALLTKSMESAILVFMADQLVKLDKNGELFTVVSNFLNNSIRLNHTRYVETVLDILDAVVLKGQKLDQVNDIILNKETLLESIRIFNESVMVHNNSVMNWLLSEMLYKKMSSTGKMFNEDFRLKFLSLIENSPIYTGSRLDLIDLSLTELTEVIYNMPDAYTFNLRTVVIERFGSDAMNDIIDRIAANRIKMKFFIKSLMSISDERNDIMRFTEVRQKVFDVILNNDEYSKSFAASSVDIYIDNDKIKQLLNTETFFKRILNLINVEQLGVSLRADEPLFSRDSDTQDVLNLKAFTYIKNYLVRNKDFLDFIITDYPWVIGYYIKYYYMSFADSFIISATFKKIAEANIKAFLKFSPPSRSIQTYFYFIDGIRTLVNRGLSDSQKIYFIPFVYSMYLNATKMGYSSDANRIEKLLDDLSDNWDKYVKKFKEKGYIE